MSFEENNLEEQNEYTSLEMEMENKQKTIGLLGLQNIGNTCYMNSAIQSILNCVPLVKLIQSTKIPPTARALFAFNSLVNIACRKKKGNIHSSANPKPILLAVCSTNQTFANTAQHDAQEFLRALLDKFREESNFKNETNLINTNNNNNKNLINLNGILNVLFEGKLVSSIICTVCQKRSDRFDEFLDLSICMPDQDVIYNRREAEVFNVDSNQSYFKQFTSKISNVFFSEPFNIRLSECFETFFEDEYLVDENRYYCETCGGYTEGQKYLRISKLPEILCIHLKRFDINLFGSSKIYTPVSFPLEFDFEEYTKKKLYVENGSDNQNIKYEYELFALINHMGGCTGGHYIAFAKNKKSKKWYIFDDLVVKEVEEEVVKAREAYVLFYRRKINLTNEQIKLKQQIKNFIKTRELPIERLDGAILRTIPSFMFITKKIFTCYIPKIWYFKFKCMSNAGPINTQDYVCRHNALKSFLNESDFIQIPISCFHNAISLYGGIGPAIISLKCSKC
eukprot:TRINITY_DN1169_c0_g1_i2.p1 TRINITY_DN1169_c0_g1~~TRINITY_DN1169_c0_g1_i2.p1  ORF type:complete len:509 (-),score=151.10 TRINITY_DN1169_c0_g1_i2:79-1605(-)